MVHGAATLFGSRELSFACSTSVLTSARRATATHSRLKRPHPTPLALTARSVGLTSDHLPRPIPAPTHAPSTPPPTPPPHPLLRRRQHRRRCPRALATCHARVLAPDGERVSFGTSVSEGWEEWARGTSPPRTRTRSPRSNPAFASFVIHLLSEEHILIGMAQSSEPDRACARAWPYRLS